MDLSPEAQLVVNVTLLWIGFGAVCGFLARAIIPGKEPSNPIWTFLIGVLGSSIGSFLLYRFLHQEGDFNPISPVCFGASLLCSLFLLVIVKGGIYLVYAIQRSARKPDNEPRSGR